MSIDFYNFVPFCGSVIGGGYPVGAVSINRKPFGDLARGEFVKALQEVHRFFSVLKMDF